MNWKFWKKESIKNKEKQKKKYGYLVTMNDPIGDTTREVATFGAEKKRDEDGVMWLINEEKAFKEIFPLDYEHKIIETKEELEASIKKLEKYVPKKDENELNKESDLLRLRRKLKVVTMPKGSFIKINAKGIPHLEYVRYKSVFVPLKRNIEFATVHTPSEPLLKNVLRATLQKKEKYKQGVDTMTKLFMIVFMIMMVVGFAINGWWSVKNYTWADDSNYAKMQQRIDEAPLLCAEMYGEAGDNFIKASQNAVNITEQMKDKLNPAIKSTTKVANVK